MDSYGKFLQLTNNLFLQACAFVFMLNSFTHIYKNNSVSILSHFKSIYFYKSHKLNQEL